MHHIHITTKYIVIVLVHVCAQYVHQGLTVDIETLRSSELHITGRLEEKADFP